jgi:hypothetical protein
MYPKKITKRSNASEISVKFDHSDGYFSMEEQPVVETRPLSDDPRVTEVVFRSERTLGKPSKPGAKTTEDTTETKRKDRERDIKDKARRAEGKDKERD